MFGNRAYDWKTATRRPEERHELAAGDIQVEVLDRGRAAARELLLDLGQGQECHLVCRPPSERR
jgi:hypothetical protein